MKSAKRMALLLLFIAFLESSQQPVQADNTCQQACSSNYQLCLVDAEDGYDQCMLTPDGQLSYCTLQADQFLYECLDNCSTIYPTWQGCPIQCYQHWGLDNAQCEGQFNLAQQNCLNAQQNANSLCVDVYDACYNNCPPD